MYYRKLLTAICLAVTIWPAVVCAEDKRLGEDLAKRLCARCHAIDNASASPSEKAPPFRVITNRYSVWSLQEALAEGIVTGHAEMPEFVLNPDEINNLLTFMDTFTTPKSAPQ